MNRITASLVALLLCLLAGAASADGAEAVGRVKTTSGEAFLTGDEGRRPAAVGDPVYLGDLLETGSDGAIGVTFRDESRLSVGPDTRLEVDAYVYLPEESRGSFVARMTRGTLLYVSGLIANLTPDAAKVETPVGTIGVRGTRFLVGLEP